MNNGLIKYIFIFLGLLFVQFLFLNDFVLWEYGFCFIYVAFIIILPLETPPILLLLIAFFNGLIIDVMANTLGVNAAACVLIAFLRPWILKIITPRGGYDTAFEMNMVKSGWQWFIAYSFTMIFIHHFVLFTLEAASLEYIWNILLRTALSSVITWLMLIMGQLIFTSEGA